MASEWVMYLSVLAIGVLTIAGVTITFNSINVNTIENTVEVGLNEVATEVAKELKDLLEFGLATDPLTRVMINRTMSLPTDIASHFYEIRFRVLPGTNHWFIEAYDVTDIDIPTIIYETALPWRNVTLSNAAGTGLPVLESQNLQHNLCFYRSEGTTTFRLYVL